jgi:hypothetical protein
MLRRKIGCEHLATTKKQQYMSVNENLSELAGNWSGVNKLNLSWMPDPIRESTSTAKVQTRVNDQCLEIAYTWDYEGEAQEGLIVLSGDGKSDSVKAFWTDSWHSRNVVMPCDGLVSANGSVNLKGFYGVPDHPDWGWRTKIIPGRDTFKYLMFNVSPEGIEEWAVEMEFTR